jgi:hypothetical protein
MERCIEWLTRYDVGPRQLSAILRFFDLTTMEFRKNLPSIKRTVWWFPVLGLVYAFSTLGPLFLWDSDRAYYEFRQDGYAFSATTEDVRTVNSWWRLWADHHRLEKTDCDRGTTAPSAGFTETRRAQLCQMLNDPKLSARVATTIAEQRNFSIGGVAMSFLGVVIVAFGLKRIEMAHALRKKIDDADSQMSLDFGEVP